MKKKSLLILTISILTLLLVSSGISVQAGGPEEPSVEYVSHRLNKDLTVTIKYNVKSTDPPVLYWNLYSSCFTAEKLIGVSEPYTLDEDNNRICFNKNYDPGETRNVCITLSLDYNSLVLGDIDYSIYWLPQDKVKGQVLGPVCPPDMIIPETALGTLGVALSLLAAAGLITAYRRGTFTVTVT